MLSFREQEGMEEIGGNQWLTGVVIGVTTGKKHLLNEWAYGDFYTEEK